MIESVAHQMLLSVTTGRRWYKSIVMGSLESRLMTRIFEKSDYVVDPPAAVRAENETIIKLTKICRPKLRQRSFGVFLFFHHAACACFF